MRVTPWNAISSLLTVVTGLALMRLRAGMRDPVTVISSSSTASSPS